MRIKFLMVLVLSFLSFLELVPYDAHACSCERYPDYVQLLMESDIVFQGTVTKITQNDHNQEIHFDVTFPQKNMPQSNEFILEQSTGDTCTIDYNVGETYQVFVYGDSIIGKTNMCSTKQITGFHEYYHEDENDQTEYFREDYSILTQYNLGTIILPIVGAILISIFVVWRSKK